MPAAPLTQAPTGSRVARAARWNADPWRQPVKRVELRLPVPVSVNAIHSPRKGGGLRLSDAYSAWIEAAGWRLLQQRPGRIVGRYQITLAVPEESRADLDNLIKATSDLLQLHGVVRNDRMASRIVLEWQRAHAEAVVEIVPFELSSPSLDTRTGRVGRAA